MPKVALGLCKSFELTARLSSQNFLPRFDFSSTYLHVQLDGAYLLDQLIAASWDGDGAMVTRRENQTMLAVSKPRP